MLIKKIFGLIACLCLTSCFFGANELSSEISKDFYLVQWDERDWIAYSKDEDSIFEAEKIIINHDVLAVGSNDDFIIIKQHPCENRDPHFMDYDNLKPNLEITNFFIIDTRNGKYKLHFFDNEKGFNDGRIRLGIPVSLSYNFTDNNIE